MSSKFSFLKKQPAQKAPAAKQTEEKAPRATRGKRNSSDYVQLLAYIKRETRNRLDDALYEEKKRGHKLEISELVDDLLNEWLNSRHS